MNWASRCLVYFGIMLPLVVWMTWGSVGDMRLGWIHVISIFIGGILMLLGMSIGSRA